MGKRHGGGGAKGRHTAHTKGQSPSLRHRNKLNEKAPRGEVGGGRQRRVSTWHAASQLLRPTEQNPPSTPPIVNADQDKLEQRRRLSIPHSHSVRRLGRRTGGGPLGGFFWWHIGLGWWWGSPFPPPPPCRRPNFTINPVSSGSQGCCAEVMVDGLAIPAPPL